MSLVLSDMMLDDIYTNAIYDLRIGGRASCQDLVSALAKLKGKIKNPFSATSLICYVTKPDQTKLYAVVQVRDERLMMDFQILGCCSMSVSRS